VWEYVNIVWKMPLWGIFFTRRIRHDDEHDENIQEKIQSLTVQ